jgi:paraquat-inducible protein A
MGFAPTDFRGAFRQSVSSPFIGRRTATGAGGSSLRRDLTKMRPIICHDCGLLLTAPSLPDGGVAACPRCGATLYRHRRDSIERALGLVVAALILFVVTHGSPFLTFRMEGLEQPSRLATGAVELYEQGLWPLAGLVFLVAILVPLIKLLSLAAVLTPLHRGRRPRWLAPLFRFCETLHPWAMMEVYLLGVFVAYVKLIDLATIDVGVGLFAFAALILVMVAIDSVLEPRDVWEEIRPSDHFPVPAAGPGRRLIGCHACALVSAVPAEPHGVATPCPRCGAALHHRKPDSIARTWALVLTSVILYVPANVFPMMTVISFGKGSPDTILSGVEELIAAGMWPLALLVFFASITVPLLKLLSLSFLLISVQRRSAWRRRDRTVLYRIIEGIGRWSMIDIFMISILVALVRLGSIATIEPGVAAIAFAGVVVITMIAAMVFDPRLIWDAAEERHERRQA